MKTFGRLLLIFAFCGWISLSAHASTTRPLLSDEYANKLEICAPYVENIFYKGRSTHGYFTIKSEEYIIGLRNGKCVTNSVIKEKSRNYKIATITCQYNEEQYPKLSSTIKEAKLNATKEKHYRRLYNYYVKQRPDVCQTIDHMKEYDD